jgi:hypothetical protein
MNRNLRLLITLLLALMLFIPSKAEAIRIFDNYYGADDHGYGDVIGDPDRFGIDWMDVSITGSQMDVVIKTAYPGYDTIGAGTEYGDFFISIDGWNPYGSDPYVDDNSTNGETWEYAFDVQTGGLYDIATDQSRILLSNDVMPSSGYIYRNGQEVAIDTITPGLTPLSNTRAGSYDGSYLSFIIDVSGLNWNLADLGFHWAGATCANDVIEGGVPVPEPASMILLGTGLIVLAGFGRKKILKKKN